MRTTLAIDDDILAAARHLAEREGRSIGEVLSELARQGLARQQRPHRASGGQRNGIPLLPHRAGAAPVTLDLVNRLRDESA